MQIVSSKSSLWPGSKWSKGFALDGADVANSSAAFWIGLAAEISGLRQGHMVL